MDFTPAPSVCQAGSDVQGQGSEFDNDGLAELGIHRVTRNMDGTPIQQTVDGQHVDEHTSMRASMKKTRKTFRRSSFKTEKTAAHEEGAVKSTFVDAAAMKEKVRQNLSKPKHTVTDYYKDYGVCQQIARSSFFDKMTLFVIAVNAIWIMIDTDENDAAILLDADVIFIIMENFFCLFFSFEWFVRFMSFKRKFDGCKDAWFVFDTVMVTMMVAETWVFTCLLIFFMQGSEGGGGGGNLGVMRLARLMRLSRMARMGKLLRVMPELMIMIKGMLAATRSVCFTLGLLVIIMYVFAIAFVQLAAEIPDLQQEYFSTVPGGIYTLVIYGIFLDSVGTLTDALQPHPHLATLFYLFVLIGSLTVMNMLIGVLCEVVSAVAATEQEEMLVSYVHEKISKVMAILDSDGGGSISKKEFQEILDNAEAVRCLADVGIDVFALVDLADYIFEDDDAQNQAELELDFGKFMEVVLQLRGTNQATVKDIVDLRKFMRLSLMENYKQTQAVLQKLEEGAQLSKELLKESQKASKLGHSNSNLGAMTSIKPVPSGPVKPYDDLVSEDGFYIDSIPKGRDTSIEGGPPPQLPKLTPGGQLLSFVPILIDDLPIAMAATGAQDNVALSGDWSPLENDSFRHLNEIPSENENVPSNFSKAAPMSSFQALAKHRKTPAPNVSSSNTAAVVRKAGDIADARFSTSGVGVDRTKIGSESEIEALQLHVEALQLQVDHVCTELASCLNNAIQVARRSTEIGKATSCNL